jgi:ribosome-associated protein
VSATIRIAADELVFTFARSSGAGGQNVNKVNSKAQMRWNINASPGVAAAVKQRFLASFASRVTDDGWVVIASETHRDQPRNREDCISKLRDMLVAVARPPKPRRPTRPTRGSVARRLDSKRRRGETKSGRRDEWSDN